MTTPLLQNGILVEGPLARERASAGWEPIAIVWVGPNLDESSDDVCMDLVEVQRELFANPAFVGDLVTLILQVHKQLIEEIANEPRH